MSRRIKSMKLVAGTFFLSGVLLGTWQLTTGSHLWTIVAAVTMAAIGLAWIGIIDLYLWWKHG